MALSPVLAAVCLAALLQGARAQAAPTKRLHILFLLTDDLGFNAPGYANPRIISPTLDRLAAGGLKLDNLHVYRYCSPTRGSFLTGRYPYKLAATRANFIPPTLPDGINVGYSMLPERLSKAGYVSHHVGKWHQGNCNFSMTPVARGFNTSFGFLEGGEDHWTSQGGAKCGKVRSVDLAFGNQTHPYTPAYGLNGTKGDVEHYTGTQFAKHAVSVIHGHDQNQPLFLYMALHNTHAPVEAPQSFVDKYSFNDTKENNFNAQVSFVDASVKNVTDALVAAGMWDDSIVIWASDNGAPVNVAGSNHPLKGSKGSFWEGGYRVRAFVTGGQLPAAMRGKTLDGMLHVSDFYTTFTSLAGLDPADPSPSAPAPIDGLDIWPYLSGQVATSPRTEMVLDHLMHCVPPGEPAACHTSNQTPDFPSGHYPNHTTGVLVSRHPSKPGWWKLLVGPAQFATWYGVFTPNTTVPVPKPADHVECAPPNPCLYNLETDPTEHLDVSGENPDVLAFLLKRFKELEGTHHPPKANPPDATQGYCAAVARTGGFVAPWL